MKITYFQDTVCPWCRVGKVSLDKAIAQWKEHSGEEIELEVRSFLLDTNVPEEGYDFQDYIKWKFGEALEENESLQLLDEIARYLEVTFNYEKITKLPNTIPSHKLIKLAPPDKQMQILSSIQKSYFEDGLDISDNEVLTQIGIDHGLKKEKIEQFLNSDELRETILDDYSYARNIGMKTVPVYVIDEEYVINGAHAPNMLLEIFEKATNGTL